MALRRAAHLDTMYQELPLPDRFQAARDDGFDAVELWSWEDRDLAAVRAAADRAGICASALTTRRTTIKAARRCSPSPMTVRRRTR